ncbi:MAG: ChbG/HpnK family deacetylase [Bacteroidetes bacterium]|nr:ChbG/HpnK family deacetylase [Bacteroidota bacterium]
MKKIFQVILLCMFFLSSQAQQKANPRLIIRGDDMGSSQSSNLACLESYKNGIETSIEVMVVAPWFPEAARLLKENPGVDVGLHLTITSEWDNIKWRPLTHCPSLTDKNGYFLPMMWPNPNYPGLAIIENKWKLAEIEQEFRAQIEMALKNIPHLSHLSGHMGSTNFDKKVEELTQRLASEYNLTHKGDGADPDSGINGIGYDGPHKTSAEKESSFIKMLNRLEAGKTYVFVDHPALDNIEIQAVHHIGYEDVAKDRQGVIDLFTSSKIKELIREKGIELINYNDATKALPRSTPEMEKVSSKGISNYLKAVKENKQDLHSLMILRHGKVIAQSWFGDNAPNKNHIMNSVSKTFTATAIGFAVAENRLKVTDKVISFFPNDLPETISPYLAELQIRDLLTMSVGHDIDPTDKIRTQNGSWERLFLATPIVYKPGIKFVYNSMASYMLSAIVTKVTGEKVIDYLYPRLFRPLGITGAVWETSPTGINKGGFGLYIKTEDMARMGQFLLQKGNWNGKQLLPEAWFDEATSVKITQSPVWVPSNIKSKDSDWVQGYCYQLWRCRNNAYRADGANGQFIIVLPEKDAVVVTTANINDMQAEINLIWKYLLPAFE